MNNLTDRLAADTAAPGGLADAVRTADVEGYEPVTRYVQPGNNDTALLEVLAK